MANRTTIVLDAKSRRAARELALHWECSSSEAIRRAVVRERDALLGQGVNAKTERRRLLQKLFVLFEDNDPAAEVARLKAEDEGF
ncbi:MAG TPA: hypothetical protein VNO21_09400 [Polyangiaceae bacterium]|nr:hypothetical protein [Polyangiaceae bacterium]